MDLIKEIKEIKKEVKQVGKICKRRKESKTVDNFRHKRLESNLFMVVGIIQN